MALHMLTPVTRESPKPDLDMLGVHDPKHGPAYSLAQEPTGINPPPPVGKSGGCPKPSPRREWLGPKTRETEAELLPIQAVCDL